MANYDISLKDLIRAVSDELLASRQDRLAENRPAIFEVNELTIEAGFVVSDSSKAGGGFDLKIVKADAGVEYKKDTVHKITLKLEAIKDHDSIFTELGDEVPLRPRIGDS
jgi:Trypsin-co-occurring domain 2